MSEGAYSQNGQHISPQAFYAVACDPQRSVVVEACAGAGKTWMLVSRILRAMLEGASPSSILAITFTRKAAGEMRERLNQWLREFAQDTEEKRIKELCDRGYAPAQAQQLVTALAQLYPAWLASSEKPRISTIHGWFSGLVRGLPMDVLASLGLPPQWQLLEDTEAHWSHIWSALLQALNQRRDEAAHALFVHELVQGVGLHNLQEWLRTALNQRMEITLAQQAGTLLNSVPSAAVVFPSLAHLSDPLDLLDQADVRQAIEQMGRDLGTGKTTAKKLADAIVQAFMAHDLATRFECLRDALLTAKGEPRTLKGVVHDGLRPAQDMMLLLCQAQAQNKAHRQHHAMVWATHLLFDEYARYKRAQGFIDMADLELAAASLHQHPALAGWVQERLDLRVQHLLIDEFQDTSPLQWQTLYNWMSAYAGAGVGQTMRVFIVGDPKQSIYGFRRADPRVFEAASRFVCEDMGGVRLACDHTRRNLPAVINTVNQVMSHMVGQGGFQGFRMHTTEAKGEGVIRVLPDTRRPAKAAKSATNLVLADEWRDSLKTPKHAPDEALAQQEATQCAKAIAWMVQHEKRQLGDFFVLARKRSDLAEVADALAQLGLAHVFPENTRLMETPEAQDLMAVLEAIVMPSHDLALARALRSPAFDASDQVLMALARHVKACSSLDDGAVKGLGRWSSALMQMPLDMLSVSDQACIQFARRMFASWREQAQQLPPHDLLQRVVDDTQWRTTLAKRLPPAMLRQALLYLDTVVTESLMLWGGRDATPARWLREMRQLKTKLPSEAMKGVVQLLTIHGAKGLEANVVMLVNCDPKPPNANSYAVLVDWPVGSHHPTACAFVGRASDAAPSLSGLSERMAQSQYLEECNALYVALTRAREALMFSRTEPASSNGPRASWWQHLWASQALQESQRWALPEQANASKALPTCEVDLPAQVESTLSVLPKLLMPQSSDNVSDERGRHDKKDMDAWRGTLVHRVLEWATACPVSQRTPTQMSLWMARACSQYPPEPDWLVTNDLSDVLAALTDHVWQTLNHPTSAAWLDPAQCVWAGNEVAIWHEGRLHRLDRLVLIQDPDGAKQWCVIDYKMHESPHTWPDYVAQLTQYARAVSAQQPGEQVRAAFINRLGVFLELDLALED